jgi:CopG family transcriptional regulator / antitoxin EndoAI
MKGGQVAMQRRINITLPEETLDLIDRVAQPGDRSRFIDEAIKHYIEEIGRGNLRKQLKEGAIRRAQRDLALAEEWFTLDEEAWQAARR